MAITDPTLLNPDARGLRGDWHLYARLARYVAPYRWLLVAGFFTTLAFAALDAFSFVMLLPFLKMLFDQQTPTFDEPGRLNDLLRVTVGRVVDAGMQPQDLLLVVIGLVLVVFLLKNIVDFLRAVLVVRLEQSVVRDLRNQVYRHLLELDLRFFHRTRAGQIIQRLSSDVDQLRLLLTKNLFTLITSVFQVLVTIAFLVAISVPLTFVALVVVPVLFGVWGRMLRRLRRGDRNVMMLAGEVTSHLQETVLGVRQVKAAAGEPFEGERYRRLTQRYFKAHIRNERIRALASPLSEMVAALGTAVVLWYGGHLVLVEQSIGGGDFVLFLGLTLKMYQPAKWLSKFPSMVGPGLVAAERIFEFVDTPIEMVDPPDARPFTGFAEALRFEDVSFHYHTGEPVVKHVSFTVRPGEVVALVGPSGGGKSTLIDLAARFYDPTDGRITVDGVDLREFGARSLRAQLGIVTQDTVLFHDTVRNNIAYALPGATPEQVEAAARAANAHEFIMRLPEAYETVLGERAMRLSGGQRQRIAIARAILRDPPILMFDEATSALDSESERLVQDAIERLLRGRTVFVIAHRLSTVRNADQILVVDDGRIVERGKHDELIATGGLYRKLHRLQLGASSVEEPASAGVERVR
ncbi:MAG TPA: ABC transporter ATP-binding protein [Longimicrobiales bacterium]|nr:ABC transporter ATP-binding protein [Longimicrobiales bacterium]